MKEFKLKKSREYLEEKITRLEAEIIRLNDKIRDLEQNNNNVLYTMPISGSFTYVTSANTNGTSVKILNGQNSNTPYTDCITQWTFTDEKI